MPRCAACRRRRHQWAKAKLTGCGALVATAATCSPAGRLNGTSHAQQRLAVIAESIHRDLVLADRQRNPAINHEVAVAGSLRFSHGLAIGIAAQLDTGLGNTRDEQAIAFDLHG